MIKKSSSWVAIKSGEKVLIAKRSTIVKNSGLWNFFGGKINDGETPLDAAVRELNEEAGILVNTNQLIYIGQSLIDNIIHLFVFLSINEINPILNEEHTEFKWILIDDLLAMNKNKIHKPTSSFLDTYFK
jgi:8-oxo-dGTP diphosphatase